MVAILVAAPGASRDDTPYQGNPSGPLMRAARDTPDGEPLPAGQPAGGISSHEDS